MNPYEVASSQHTNELCLRTVHRAQEFLQFIWPNVDIIIGAGKPLKLINEMLVHIM